MTGIRASVARASLDSTHVATTSKPRTEKGAGEVATRFSKLYHFDPKCHDIDTHSAHCSKFSDSIFFLLID